MNLKRFSFGAVALWLALASGASGAVTESSFRTPPRADRPETWFHFIGGNIAEDGLRADLDAIAGAGISGIQLFQGDSPAWPGVTNQIRCLTPAWERMLGRLAGSCADRSLRFTMQNCPGWAMSGGPWNSVTNAMRHLAVGRTDVVGGHRVDVTLAKAAENDEIEEWRGYFPFARNRDYRDVAVIAFPTPLDDTGVPLVPVAVRSNRPELPWNAWLTGQTNNLVIAPGLVTPAWAEFEFARPVTVRTVVLPPLSSLLPGWTCYKPATSLRIDAVDGTATTVVAAVGMPANNWQDLAYTWSIACSDATARVYRVTFRNGNRLSLASLRFLAAARQDDWEGLAGWTLRANVRGNRPVQDAGAWVDPATVVDLTGKMDAAGRLVWDAPAGNWTVLRIGHVYTGRFNGPAPAEVVGPECDKLSPAGAEGHFAGYIGRLAGVGGPVHGKLDTMLIDSWECATQTWTPGLGRIFEARWGYPLERWMPALFGWVVADPVTTERFLLDWRRLLGELVTSNYYGRMSALAHDAGLRFQFETAFGDIVCGDILEYFKYADTPMCEFWQPARPRNALPLAAKPVRPAVSAAHLYGKKRVAAEAFTSGRLTFGERLRDLRYCANGHLAAGVTHLVFHTYTHNPRTDFLPPGSSFGGNIGTPFLRGETWWGFMPLFTDYFARCGELLEDGLPVSDVLWYLGDEVGQRPDENAPFPAGYRYDYCNSDAILNVLRVEKGLMKTPRGIAYRVLWIPDCRRLRPEVAEKLASFAEQGGRVAFERLPMGPATLSGGEKSQERFAAALARLRAKALSVGQPLADVLEKAGLAPDVAGGGALWNHRRADDGRIDRYFVAAADPAGFRGELDFRCVGDAEFWDPVDGSVTPARVTGRTADGRTRIGFDLPPAGAVFVVFHHDRPPSAAVGPVVVRRVSPAVDAWSVSFPAGWGAKDTVLKTLVAWQDIPGATPEGRAFSGTATYRTAFAWGNGIAAGERVFLDLGRVESLARVRINGRAVGAAWCPPYRVEVTDALVEGKNELAVEVTDTWFNRLVYDAGRPRMERKTWTIAGPGAGEALRPAGLFGPVALVVVSGPERGGEITPPARR